MLTDSATATLVEKEQIAHLKFPEGEVLHDPLAVAERRKRLGKATFLGNIEHNKIRIYFEDNEGLKEVNTTIWATTQKNIVLKYGMVIPIRRIVAIKMI